MCIRRFKCGGTANAEENITHVEPQWWIYNLIIKIRLIMRMKLVLR